MSLPPIEVIVGLLLAAIAALVLLGSLIAANLLLRVINRRLATLQNELVSIGAATEPLGGSLTGIAVNVRNLREAAATFRAMVAEQAKENADRTLSPNGRTR